ncbi:histidinol-phosphate transaminase [uncultured Jatrophihabitans sp.]|uniref:histidinol-phosphate transaminase n=1 Tax=uncultured Jatrophihabitans sp. TaxID=1610747 RepID=UPI0035CBDB0B
MSLSLRPMLERLPAYVPGRSVPGAIKLASNETSYPPLPHVIERIAAVAAQANRYPDNGAAALTDALAQRLGVRRDQVRVGGGSVALCTQLVQAVADADDEIVFAWRSFEAYPIITAVSGASAIQVPLVEHVHDLAGMAERITGKTRLLFVCNPNNPTGTAVGREALVRFLRAVPPDVVVALDEAYREFVADPDVPDGLTLLAEFPNLVVLRTFSKAYGLAGLRVGYAIAADPAITAALAQTQVPFSISTVAQAAALASLEPAAQAQMVERVREVGAERARVRDALLRLGYAVPPSQANFVWLPLGAATLAWAARCEEHKVVVRAFADSGVRVTIGNPTENDAFLAAAEALAPAG